MTAFIKTHFIAFLERRVAKENWDFPLAVKELKKHGSASLATDIYDRFGQIINISKESQMQLDHVFSQKEPIKTGVDYVNVFNNAVTETNRHLLGLFNEFKESLKS
eukprot:GEMP01053376.1.p1 GENE.GEMP01053376.1~~GEMP01053376.1.p1  ORF type:complete len:106 (+),score=2.93 GEMP01053376.1:425-742(+)